MAIQMIVNADNGQVFADHFLLIKPSRSIHIVGMLVQLFERCSSHLGNGRIVSKTTLRPEHISENLAYMTLGQNANTVIAELRAAHPVEAFFDVICVAWVERNAEAWHALALMRWDAIWKHSKQTSSAPNLFLINPKNLDTHERQAV